ncbi:MAG: hypothetical protein ACOYVD_10000 [Bacillota bacterium]
MQIRDFANKNIYSEIAKELTVLAEMEGAGGTCLNIIENLPPQVQLKLVLNLAKSNNRKLIPFFSLLSEEMTGEIQKIAERTLKKFESMGVYIETPGGKRENQSEIVGTFATPTRLEGNCVLVFVTESAGSFQAHYFSLAFNHLGVKEYFQYKSRNKNDILNSLKKQNFVCLTIDEGRKLLSDALGQNKKYNTKYAGGFSQYCWFVEPQKESSFVDNSNLTRKLSKENFPPKTIVNAYLLGLKNMDAGLIYDLSGVELQNIFGTREDFIENWSNPLEKYNFIKSIHLSSWSEGESLFYLIRVVASDENEDLRKIDFIFKLSKAGNTWLIDNVEIKDFVPIGKEDPLNPLNFKVYADIYKINNPSLFRKHFENWPEIHLTGEFDGGLCYKWFKLRNQVKDGIDICQDVYGEFIITNKELIIFNSKLKNIAEISYKLMMETKGFKDIRLEFVNRNCCTVREIYRVIGSQEALLSDTIDNRGVLYIPEEEVEKWYKVFAENYNETFFLGDTKIFQIKNQHIDIQAIFSGRDLLILTYRSKIDAILKHLEVVDAGYIEIGSYNSDSVNNWNKLKYLCRVKKNPMLSLLVPLVTKQNLARQMGVLI